MVCCREAAQHQYLQSPLQYGVWQVVGLGLVVAFRGTSSWDDVFVDINVRPTPLTSDQGIPYWRLHCIALTHVLNAGPHSRLITA